jgi:hypothetical protein
MARHHIAAAQRGARLAIVGSGLGCVAIAIYILFNAKTIAAGRYILMTNLKATTATVRCSPIGGERYP